MLRKKIEISVNKTTIVEGEGHVREAVFIETLFEEYNYPANAEVIIRYHYYFGGQVADDTIEEMTIPLSALQKLPAIIEDFLKQAQEGWEVLNEDKNSERLNFDYGSPTPIKE